MHIKELKIKERISMKTSTTKNMRIDDKNIEKVLNIVHNIVLLI